MPHSSGASSSNDRCRQLPVVSQAGRVSTQATTTVAARPITIHRNPGTARPLLSIVAPVLVAAKGDAARRLLANILPPRRHYLRAADLRLLCQGAIGSNDAGAVSALVSAVGARVLTNLLLCPPRRMSSATRPKISSRSLSPITRTTSGLTTPRCAVTAELSRGHAREMRARSTPSPATSTTTIRSHLGQAYT